MSAGFRHGLDARRLATSIGHRLSAEKRVDRLSTALAAAWSAVRVIASPTLLIPTVTSVSPDWCRSGHDGTSAMRRITAVLVDTRKFMVPEPGLIIR
jgi:hypothetical protein